MSRPANPLFLQGLRKCNACQEVKGLDSFSRAGNSTGHQYSCKPCAAENSRKHYRDDPSKHKKSSRERKKRILDSVRALKNVPCADCGGTFPPVCMDFDHLDDKILGVSAMVSQGFSLENILAEIKKCDVVCANCHRVRTETRHRVRHGGVA